MALGERRANAVRDYMMVKGIAGYRIETVSAIAPSCWRPSACPERLFPLTCPHLGTVSAALGLYSVADKVPRFWSS